MTNIDYANALAERDEWRGAIKDEIVRLKDITEVMSPSLDIDPYDVLIARCRQIENSTKALRALIKKAKHMDLVVDVKKEGA